MKNLLSLLMLSISLTSVKAQDALMLEKDQKAPFTGILIKPETVQDLRKAVIERDGLIEQKASYERTIELYKKNEELYTKKVDLLTTQNDKLALRLADEREIGTWERIGWVSLGIVATGIAVYGLKTAVGQ